MTKGEANKECRTSGGSLAIPTSKESTYVILKTLRRKYEENGGNVFDDGKSVWINIREDDDQAIVEPPNVIYTNYGPDEVKEKNRCVFMDAESGSWYDAHCNSNFSFVCEMKGK